MATYNANKHGVRFGVTGNMANKLASLTDAGPLLVHKENWLAVVGATILPPPGTNNLVPISYYVIEDILSAAWIKTLELRQHPMGYTITVDSVGQMLADLDAKGMSWDPASSIHEMRLRATKTALTLPASDRALDVSDINPFGANTGTFYDHMSSYALSNGEFEDVDLFRQFRSLTAGGFCAASMTDPTFLAQISFIQAAAIGQRDGTSLPELAIAALSVAFMKRTRPPDTKLDGFVPFGGALDEIARRNADSDAERFKPLFEQYWRGYDNIAAAFNADGITGQWVFNAATSLAARWGLGSALTPAVASAVDTYLVKAKQHITLTEGLGPVFNSIIFPTLFPKCEILLGTDSAAAAAVQLGTASAPKLIALQRRQGKGYGEGWGAGRARLRVMVRLWITG